MDKRRELGHFLKSRRARLMPQDLGLPAFGKRRLPGLRREELAQLAGVSVDYYVRLEQGRAGQASQGVLDALARALELDDAERAHLYDLSRPARRKRRELRPERVRPELRRLVDALEGIPAMVIGRRMDVLAWNPLAAALVVDWGALPRGETWPARCSSMTALASCTRTGMKAPAPQSPTCASRRVAIPMIRDWPN
jgi:transcriptional regulator with XRE-family HTH domain